MGTNKVVTVVLLDVNRSMDIQSDNGETFFERSKNSLKKMLMRKMFSQDNDEISIILFGADDTDNQLARGSNYQGISIFSRISLPTWDLYRKVEKIELSDRSSSNWIEALIVAIDFIKAQTIGRRFKDKQVIVFSNCAGDTSANEDSVSPLLSVMEGENIQLIVIGNDVQEEYSQEIEIPQSMQLMLNTVTKLESAVHFSFSEIEKDFEYFAMKRKMGRLTKINFTIGSNFQIPVRWMKVTNEETRWKWDYPPPSIKESASISHTSSTTDPTTSHITSMTDPTTSHTTNPNVIVQEKPLEYVTDVVKRTNFGGSLIELSYADLEAMKRNTGPASFIYIGSIKNKKISRSMFVGNDVYVIVADKDARSVSMFSAFVDALIKAGKFGIARRISVKNGKISIGALLPVSDDLGKAMYFMKLPFAEWVKKIPEKHLPQATNEEGMKAMTDLIDAAMLPEDLLEEGKGLLVRCPTFQSRCHALSLRAVGRLPEYSLPDHPDHIMRILKPHPMSEEAINALQRIEKIFPYTPKEEDTSFKRKKGGVKSDPNPLVPNPIQIKAEPPVKIKEDILNILEDVKQNYDDIFSEEMF